MMLDTSSMNTSQLKSTCKNLINMPQTATESEVALTKLPNQAAQMNIQEHMNIQEDYVNN